MEAALWVDEEVGKDRDGWEGMAVVRSGISSKISKYCSMQTLMRTPRVIVGVDVRVGRDERMVVVIIEESGIEHIWVSRITLEPDTKFGVKQSAKLVASILFVEDRRETSWRRSMRDGSGKKTLAFQYLGSTYAGHKTAL